MRRGGGGEITDNNIPLKTPPPPLISLSNDNYVEVVCGL